MKTPQGMRDAHGVGPAGSTCGQCSQCVSLPMRHPTRGHVMRSKCRRSTPFVNSHGVASFPLWRKRDQACGLFTASEA